MPVIEVQDLRKSYGGRRAVDGVSFTVDEGEIFGILGPNGAGKTTTVECVAGLRAPDAGLVRVAGLDPVARHEEVTRLLGVQLQRSELQPKLTAGEALDLYASFYERPADWRVLVERLGLEGQLRTRFGKLSGGMRQRLLIALALVGNPRAVVLDELTTGLDPRARRDTWELLEDIRADGVAVVLVTHFMEEAQRLCDRIAVIDKGRVTAVDTPAGLIDGTAASRTVAFAADTPLEQAELLALPGALTVTSADGRTVVTGTDATVDAFISLLARRAVTARGLRVTDATLDDAYLDLTGTDQP
ncbi:ABC transporter ATP-binding protein [Streptomyces litchfieldiae]|uniref:ABC transporter ATP-binding protein n=1 Tax=Streptomyces litchfieldiae TaxID=3075543 RepID=A0ABU2MP45_9ACTN|nr:ABC transporter ATP-binding protein [Streptomyces sp. DSM 44938]MDT0343231.1 ABC transporter ATP-binding protein [Streptomyces sp. DSM 44938]